MSAGSILLYFALAIVIIGAAKKNLLDNCHFFHNFLLNVLLTFFASLTDLTIA